MENLSQQKCIPCLGSVPPMSQTEIHPYLAQVKQWKLITQEGVQRLQRVFRFKDFSEALDFANKIGQIAEEENHHPAILVEWGKVTVTWWTHTARGLHPNDFIMAAKTDALQPA